MKFFTKIIPGIFFFYLAYCGLLFLIQRQVIFPRYMISGASEERIAIANLEQNWLHTSFGKVETWYLPPDGDAPRVQVPVIIFAHGNAELIDTALPEFRSITHLGIGLLLVEYPGYGRSEGAPSQTRITEVFIRAYDHLVQRKDVDATRIILWGRSLGGGAVCQLAIRRPSAAMILMSTFTSVRSFAKRYLVPGFLVRDPFDNLQALRSYSGPVLIIHGKTDEIIPCTHGRALYKAAANAKLITYPCGHNDCPPDGDILRRDVAAFLRESKIIS